MLIEDIAFLTFIWCWARPVCNSCVSCLSQDEDRDHDL